jgi:predicted RNA-binding protein YlqC (UPF0109 family)
MGCFCNFFKRLFGGKSASGCCADGSLRDLEGFVDYVVKALVDYPAEVSVSTVSSADGATIQISCRKSDIGKIVGKHGKTIMAIRSLVSGAAGRQGRRVSVEVLD